jgi:hypothetical protein
MGANIEKTKNCFRAIGSFLGNALSVHFPLWLFIVVFLACVLLSAIIGCTAAKSSVQTAVVGYTDYRGHSYLVFRALKDSESFSVVHDPDCQCLKIDLLEN